MEGDITIALWDCCGNEYTGSAWKQFVITYHLLKDIVKGQYENKIKEITKNYGEEILERLSIIFKTWVLPVIEKKYEL